MASQSRQVAGRGVLHVDDTTPSLFECPICAETERAIAIDYDSLGYPICPGCGFLNREY